MKLATNKHNSLTQVLEYLISGGIYFWVGYGAFAFLYGFQSAQASFKGLGLNLWWAVIISNVIGWVVNYLMQRYWVFASSGLGRHQTQVTDRYIFITLMDFLLSYLILYSLRKIGISPYIGMFISGAFFTVWNYYWYRFWVFPDKFAAGRKPKVTIARLFAHIPHGHRSF